MKGEKVREVFKETYRRGSMVLRDDLLPETLPYMVKGVDPCRPAPAWGYWPRDWAKPGRRQGGGGEPGGEGG